MSAIRFDTALDNTLQLIDRWLAEGRLQKTTTNEIGVIVRDALGRFALLLATDDVAVKHDSLPALREELRQKLGAHAFAGEAVLMLPSEHPAPDSILRDPLARLAYPVQGIKLLDRLQTNQDWLRPPLRTVPRLPLGVAYSIKGGVGRSTSFVMLALALARDGKKVVVIDLDLEAPGIGPLILGEELPVCGLVDWLAETLIESTDDELLRDMIIRAPAVFENGWPGDLKVIPAWGSATKDYVAKLGRVYMPIFGQDGKPHRFAERLEKLINSLAEMPDPPDVVLLDSRAGLHDVGAAVITQLGAQVFLFARDEPQSWSAYKKLFEHLRFSPQIGTANEDNDLRARLKMCAAMMEDLGSSLENWGNNAYETWLEIYDSDDMAPYSFARNAEEAPHYPLPLVFSAQVRGKKSLGVLNETEWQVIFPAFKDFVEGAKALIFASPENNGDNA